MEIGLITSKFGGTSVANQERIKGVVEIVFKNPRRRRIILSNAGKGEKENEKDKLTDVSIECCDLREKGLPFDNIFEKIAQRFEDIGRGLNCHSSVVGWLNDVDKGFRNGESRDWMITRGEWIMAQTFAKYTGGVFMDATRLIRLEKDGKVNPLTYQLIKEQLTGDSLYIIPGFYGLYEQKMLGIIPAKKSVKCFPRGGSDITGAIIAKGVKASVYENWTDVDGVKAAAPDRQSKTLNNPKTIDIITFKEMRELSYRGADVLQMDAVLPVMEAGIPINLRNTFNPNHRGTLIVPSRESLKGENVIGIAGRKGFISYQIEKAGMNQVKGVARRMLEVFEKNDISFDHVPTGLDSMSVILHKDQLDGKEGKTLTDLQKNIRPDNVYKTTNLGLVCIVGQNIPKDSTGIHAKLYATLEQAKIDVRAEIYSTGGNNIVIAVDENRLTDTIESLYTAFIK